LGSKDLSYADNAFHRILPGFIAQAGDITKGDGTGGQSIYGKTFRDENLKLQHHKRGQLTMANNGPDTNSSQFYITFGPAPWLNGYHTVFGEVVEGEEVLSQIEKAGSRDGKPKEDVKIVEAGEAH
jgi:cyclophilin family peptidyl-prolyl cis-trans isomerase